MEGVISCFPQLSYCFKTTFLVLSEEFSSEEYIVFFASKMSLSLCLCNQVQILKIDRDSLYFC